MGARLHQSRVIEKPGLAHATLNLVFLSRQDFKATGGCVVEPANACSCGVWSVEVTGLCWESSEEIAKAFLFNNREEEYSLFF